jgi:polyhydroxyalkanoate synthesis regulator protein
MEKTVIVRYTNRKLYNVTLSKYTTLTEMLKLGVGNFVVVEHGTNKDITTNVLLNALTTHFQNSPQDFEKVLPIVVKELGLNNPVVTTN